LSFSLLKTIIFPVRLQFLVCGILIPNFFKESLEILEHFGENLEMRRQNGNEDKNN
jgi:hypothetical protein